MSSFSNNANSDNLLPLMRLSPPQIPLLSQSYLAIEESKIEEEIIQVILSGKTDSLMPNSGKSVTISNHHICIVCHEEKHCDYRVWEWHGHVMTFDKENGYTPEYINGNYYERLLDEAGDFGGSAKGEENPEKVGDLGLRDFHRNAVQGGLCKEASNSCQVYQKRHQAKAVARELKERDENGEVRAGNIGRKS